MKTVDTRTYVLAIVTMLALAGAMALIGTAKKDIAYGALALIVVVASLYLLPDIIERYKDIKYEDMIKPGIVLGALVGSVLLLGKNGAQALMGAGAVILLGAGLLVASIGVAKIAEIDWKDIVKPGVVLGAMVVALLALSNPMVLVGAAALILSSAGLLVFAIALKTMPNLSWKQYLTMSGGMGLIATAMAAMALGLVGVPGALAIAGALYIYGKSIAKMPNIPRKNYADWSYGLNTMTDAMVNIGNPLTLPLLLTGVAKAAAIGVAIGSLGRGMQSMQNVDYKKSTVAASFILTWSVSAVKSLSAITNKDYQRAKVGLQTMSVLGSTVALYSRISRQAKTGGPIDLKGLKAKELSSQLRTINAALSSVDTKTLGVVIEAGNAVARIANLDLTRLGRALQIREAKLLDYLAKLVTNTNVIKDNTKPIKQTINLKKNDDSTIDPIRLHDGDNVDLATIALQLETIQSLILSQRQ
jgi:hypothetical protein